MDGISAGFFSIGDALSFITARPEHMDAIVRLMREAGDGLYEALFEQLEGHDTEYWLKLLVLNTCSGYALSNWRLACVDDVEVGGICLCPAVLLQLGVELPLTADGACLSQSFDCLYEAALNSYHVVSLAVNHLYRQNHIATALLHLARAEASIRGYQTLSLFVRQDNVIARDFYCRQGFKVCASTPQVIGSLPSFDLLTVLV